MEDMPRIELKSFPDVLIKVNTQKAYDYLMMLYESARWHWKNGYLPTEYMINAGPGMFIEVLESFDYVGSAEVGKDKKRVELEEFYKLENIDEVEKREVFKWFENNKRKRASLGQRLM